jgi:Tetratricopeptide repeat
VTAQRPLLDRDAETNALQRLTADAAHGVGGVVVLEGPAGIGKTALVRLAGELAADLVCERLDQAALLDDSDQLRFAHPLVARAVASTASAAERSAGHLKAARLLLQVGAPLDAGAVHLLVSRPAADDWVASVLGDAAAAANARGAPAEAIGYLQRALAEPAPAPLRAGLTLELGSAQLRMHQTADAQTTLRRGLQLEPPPEIRSAMATVLSQACFLGGDPDAALDVLEDERAAEHDERRLRVLDGSAIALGPLDPQRSELMRIRLHSYRHMAESEGLTARCAGRTRGPRGGVGAVSAPRTQGLSATLGDGGARRGARSPSPSGETPRPFPCS